MLDKAHIALTVPRLSGVIRARLSALTYTATRHMPAPGSDSLRRVLGDELADHVSEVVIGGKAQALRVAGRE